MSKISLVAKLFSVCIFVFFSGLTWAEDIPTLPPMVVTAQRDTGTFSVFRNQSLEPIRMPNERGDPEVTRVETRSRVQEFELPCRSSSEDDTAYIARATGLCTLTTVPGVIRDYPILDFRTGRFVTSALIGYLCAIHVNDQMASGKVNMC